MDKKLRDSIKGCVTKVISMMVSSHIRSVRELDYPDLFNKDTGFYRSEVVELFMKDLFNEFSLKNINPLDDEFRGFVLNRVESLLTLYCDDVSVEYIRGIFYYELKDYIANIKTSECVLCGDVFKHMFNLNNLHGLCSHCNTGFGELERIHNIVVSLGNHISNLKSNSSLSSIGFVKTVNESFSDNDKSLVVDCFHDLKKFNKSIISQLSKTLVSLIDVCDDPKYSSIKQYVDNIEKVESLLLDYISDLSR